jgi:hypothetical protein
LPYTTIKRAIQLWYLEGSGILSDNSSNNIDRRLRQKVIQVQKGLGEVPSTVIVLEFSSPKIKIEISL